jgi:hypothetical protein
VELKILFKVNIERKKHKLNILWRRRRNVLGFGRELEREVEMEYVGKDIWEHCENVKNLEVKMLLVLINHSYSPSTQALLSFKLLMSVLPQPFSISKSVSSIEGNVNLLNDIPKFGMPYEVNKGSKDSKTLVEVEVNAKFEYFGAH